MKNILLLILFTLFIFSTVEAEQKYSEECEKTFQNMVYEQLMADERLNAFHQVWWWVPGKILHGETEFSCTDWAKKNGVKSDGSGNVESLSMACSDLKKYSLVLVKSFECPKRTIWDGG